MQLRAIALAAALAVTTAARAAPRDDLARHWAPILYQEAHDPLKDLFAAFDFDGDWDGDNNAENMTCFGGGGCPSKSCDMGGCPLVATVYYTVIETATHWFVQYMPYHPLDWKLTNGHEHDTESILLVVLKDGSPFGAAQAMETRFHTSWLDYAADNAGVGDGAGGVDGPIHWNQSTGRPMVYSQMVGHGLCGGFSPPNYVFPDLALTCDGKTPPHIDKDGVVYSPDLPATMPTVQSGSVMAGYNLVELAGSVWPHIHEIGGGKAFKDAIDYRGERCGMGLPACPTMFGGDWEGDEGASPGEPWAQPGGSGVSADGDQFFDPAYTMSKRLKFPPPFSLEYCWNPYVGVVTGCASDTPDMAGAPVDAGMAAHGDDGGGAGADGAMVASMQPGGCGCGIGAPLGHARLFTLLALAALLIAYRRRR